MSVTASPEPDPGRSDHVVRLFDIREPTGGADAGLRVIPGEPHERLASRMRFLDRWEELLAYCPDPAVIHVTLDHDGPGVTIRNRRTNPA